MNEENIIRTRLNLKLIHNFLDALSANYLKDLILNKINYTVSNKRIKFTYGEIKIYKISSNIEHKVLPWEEFPILQELANQLELLTGQKYHVCVIQIYPSGNVGINPHRDKEMMKDTIITSISLGCKRIMKFEYKGEQVDIPLETGTLLLINPPTNNYWVHSIPKDDTEDIRISLVFRNCSNMLN